jgi:hypothetical protein
MSSSIASQPPLSLSNISTNLASAYGSTAYGAQAGAGGSTSYATASHNLSPLPIRANQISTMPPLCQVHFFPTSQIVFLLFIVFFSSSVQMIVIMSSLILFLECYFFVCEEYLCLPF